MICCLPFLISAGQILESRMDDGSQSLSEVWGVDLVKLSSSDSPYEKLSSLRNKKKLIRVSGDPAVLHSEGGSWLEAIGSWRHPTILMVEPTESGMEIPGAAAAYVALCKKLSVPLVGILQLGGIWFPEKRKLDGLPWCGKLALTFEKQRFSEEDKRSCMTDIHLVGECLKKRLLEMSL